jgi:hypothetical protein
MDIKKLEGLGNVTQEIDAAGPPTPQQEEQAKAEAKALTDAQKWGVIPYTIGGALCMFAPELKAVYSEENCLKWGESMVPVADKYGWNGPSSLPELGLVLATMSLALPSVFVIRARLAEPPGKGDTGLSGGIRAWWREWKAKRAAKVVGEAVEGVQHGG